MVYARYGEVFRTLRQQKGLPIGYFEKMGIGKSYLSKFERGQTMFRFESLDMMLQEMNVSLAEYELLLNNFEIDYQEEFIEELEEADYSQNIEALTSLYEISKYSGYHWFSLITKSRLGRLEKNEAKEIVEFLSTITQYGYLELCLVYFCIDSLETSDMVQILLEFEKKSANYYDIFKYRRRILATAYRASIILSIRKEQRLSEIILKIARKKAKRHDFFVRNLEKLAEGCYSYSFDNKASGKEAIEQSLNNFKEFDSQIVSDYYRNKLQRLGNI